MFRAGIKRYELIQKHLEVPSRFEVEWNCCKVTSKRFKVQPHIVRYSGML